MHNVNNMFYSYSKNNNNNCNIYSLVELVKQYV